MGNVWVANYYSSDYRDLKQAVAIRPPAIVIKLGRGRRGCAGTLRRCRAAERAVNALLVEIAAKHFQLAREVECVPEKHLIEDLAPDGPDQPLDERMRNRA